VLGIVHACVRLSLLELCDGADLDAGRIVARSLKRATWEPRDARAAARQSARRRRRTEADDADDNHDDWEL
jgi:hypothetical protein